MADTFTVQFTPTTQDYARGNRAVMLKSSALRVALGGMALFEFYLFYPLFRNDYGRTLLPWVILLPISFYLLILFVGIPYQVSRNVKGNDRLLAEVTWELSDVEVVLKNRYADTKYDWGSFQSLTENRDYFFLRQTATKQSYQFIPKRAFASVEQLSQFRELVNRHILAHMEPAVLSTRSHHSLPWVVLIPLLGGICFVALGAILYVWYVHYPRFPFPGTPATMPTQTSSGYVDQARFQVFSKEYRKAIPLLDQAIQLDPANGDAYYLRAYSYGHIAQTELVLQAYQVEVDLARRDIDHAIEYGVTDPNVLPGELYFLRYQIYSISHAGSYADVVAMQPVLRDNLRMAEALGTHDKYINQWIVFTYFDQHDCQAGISELQRIRQKYGLSAPPNSSLYNIEAHGYACLGQYDKALESIDKGLNIESFPERLTFRAIILYYLERKQEALNTLNGLIAADPEFHADRYYFRALVEYDLGNPEPAAADLEMGDRYSWDRGGVGAYLRGRMAYDRGEKPQAIKEFQAAYANLGWLYNPLRSDTADKLATLGQPIPSATPSVTYSLTPMPPPPAMPTPDFPLAANGVQLPPSPMPVRMDRGTGQFDVSGVNAYPVLLFQPPQPVSVQSVQSLTIHILPGGDTPSDKFEIFVWNPTTGDWTMFKQGWQEIQVTDPAQYVAPNGDIYLAIRTDTGVDILIKQLWLTLQLTLSGGTPLTLNLSP